MYVRHRPRMVRQSVFEDLRATLLDTQWLGDTTLPLLGGNPLVLIDYFPRDAQYQGEAIQPNTFALDVGEPDDLVEQQLGGGLWSQQYRFNMAFYANSDALAIAVLSDLNDRYTGRTGDDYLMLYNYLVEPPTEVVRMDVEAFRYARPTDVQAPHQLTLYFAELALTDWLDEP